MVFANQQAYYNAINRSTDAVNSGIFIDFMLQEIYETLKKRQGDSIVTMKATKDVGINVGINEQKSSGTFEKKQSNHRQRNRRTSRYQSEA